MGALGQTRARLGAIAAPVRRWWSEYWFADGTLANAVARIAVALSVLIARGVFVVDYAAYAATRDPSAYRPLGVMVLFGKTSPTPAVLEWIAGAGGVAAWMLLFGLLTRVSAVVSLFCHVVLVSWLYSYESFWSHGLNIVFLGHIAIAFGPTHAALSLDRKLRWAPLGPVPRWPALLAQLAVALMFANAAFFKLREDGFGLGWALSDNLRNILVLRHGLIDGAMPRWIRTIASHVELYRTMAVGNLVSQALPLTAVVFGRHPWVRLIGGAAFVAETIGLDVLMGLPNLHWLPLAALFVDWDHFLRKRSRAPVAMPAPSLWAATIFVVAFTGYYVATAFWGLDAKLRHYPFSSFPMYKTILAAKPYAQHQAYVFDHPEFRPFAATGPLPESKSLQRSHGAAYWALDVEVLRSSMGTALASLRAGEGGSSIVALELRRSLLAVPAYPAPPEPVVTDSGLIARTSTSGAVVALRAIPAWKKNCVDVGSIGLDRAAIRWSYLVDKRGPALPLDGRWEGDRFCATPPDHGELMLVADVPVGGKIERFFPGWLMSQR